MNLTDRIFAVFAVVAVSALFFGVVVPFSILAGAALWAHVLRVLGVL